MTKQLQSDLSELEMLQGIRIDMTDDEQSFFIGFSYRQDTRGNKILAWMCWTAVAILLRSMRADLVVGSDTSVNQEAEKDNQLETSQFLYHNEMDRGRRHEPLAHYH